MCVEPRSSRKVWGNSLPGNLSATEVASGTPI